MNNFTKGGKNRITIIIPRREKKIKQTQGSYKTQKKKKATKMWSFNIHSHNV